LHFDYFTVMNITPLLLLLLAHLTTDFLLQNKKWVADKNTNKIRSPFLYLHVGLTGLVAYLFLGRWTSFGWPLLIVITHYLIDTWKIYQKKDNLFIFLIDQFFHVLVLTICWLGMTDQFGIFLNQLKSFIGNDSNLIYFLGFLFVTWPAAFIISKFTQPWRNQLEKENIQSLEEAGKYIGVLERLLVLVFVLLQQNGAIGFLVAAKSIMRFSEKSENKLREKTEYILIGTLSSFSLALATGLIVKMATT